MLPKFMLPNLWKHFSGLFVSHWFYITLLVTHFFVINGIRQAESDSLTLIKDEFSLISTHSDKRIGNIFFSTPDYFLRLSELVPEVDAFLTGAPTKISFSYPFEGQIQTVEREFPIYLVGSRYFDAFNGRFIQGRGFERGEVFSGKPYVVLGEGALLKLFGDYDRAPSLIVLNGIEFQVIGVWAFRSQDIVENDSIFLPLGLTQFFGKESSTYVNNFILNGKGSADLLKLKKAIDKIQLNTGITPSRPEFTFETPRVSRKTDYVLSHNKVYLDVLVWLVFLGFIFSSLKITHSWMSFTQDWSVWSFMFNGDSKELGRDAINAFFVVLTFSLIGGFVLALVLMIFLKYTLKYDLAPGLIFHPSLYLYLVFFPIQTWLMFRWASRLRFSL